MAPPRLRVIALAVIEHPHRPAVLASPGYDASVGQHFRRLLGGGVEPFEKGEDAVRRELLEEIGVEIEVVRQAGCVENIFVYDSTPGHELVLVYEARLLDPELYAQEHFDGLEDDPVDAVWHPLEGPGSDLPVYPPGAVELVRGR